MTAKPTTKELIEHRKFLKLQLFDELSSHLISKEETTLLQISRFLFELLSVKLGAKNDNYLLQFSGPDYVQSVSQCRSDTEISNKIAKAKSKQDAAYIKSLIAIAPAGKIKRVSKTAFENLFGNLEALVDEE